MKIYSEYLWVWLKGLLMGAADIVPWVSWGTMAFITGIYERLINALSSVSLWMMTDLRKWEIRKIWTAIDGTFLLSLAIGVACSVLAFSSLLSAGLESHPHYLYAFFAWLIIASAQMIYKHVQHRNWKRVAVVCLALLVWVLITQITPTQIEPTYLMIFLSAAIAICAMILPGISGSFILLLLGMYEPVINAIHDKNLLFIWVFALGAIIGLLSFVRLIKYMFDTYHDTTIAALIWLMLWSLPKLWPRAQESFYPTISTTPNAIIIWIVVLFIVWYLLVTMVEKLSKNKTHL